MKKLILLATLSFAFTSCAKNKLNPSTVPSNENPNQSPTEPPPGGGGSTTTPEQKAFEQLQKDVAFYKGRYNTKDVYGKVTDNSGNGFEDLYGTRNLREVLAGVYYRGGANNTTNKYHSRSNMNPLPAEGLDNLCKEGFSTALYYYSTNYKTAKPVNNCLDRSGGAPNTLNYNQITAFSIKDFKPFLQMIHDRIKGKLTGPIYGHCWNGWHASGMMAAITLKQFCGWSDTEADAYWVKNTDGNSKGYESVRAKVKAFKAMAGLEITPEEKSLICPK